MKRVSTTQLKKRRTFMAVLLALLFALLGITPSDQRQEPMQPEQSQAQEEVLSDAVESGDIVLAADALDGLAIKGRAPKTGYSRSEFGDGWAQVDGCSVRDIMLARGLTQIEYGTDGCTVLVGVLIDPYTDKEIIFTRGSTTSADVQIDHVVALSDSWQKGAQQLDFDRRVRFANDPLNLLAVDGDANQQKGDSDAASWLPPHTAYRCQYVARQIAVKAKYGLWVTEAEHASMRRVLNGCGDQVLPVST